MRSGALLRRFWMGSLVASLGSAPNAAADSASISAKLGCRPERSPGRVLCELSVAPRGGRLEWADALVVSAPEFARPLQSRVGAAQASRAGDGSLKLPLALAATRQGSGELTVAARAVVCDSERRRCLSLQKLASASVEVGARQER